MLIDLSSLNSFWLTCNKSKSRWNDMETMMERLNIKTTKLNGEITNPYTIGVALNHRDALMKSGSSPVIILEDDARTTPNYTATVEVPDDADAFYLGTSFYGRLQNQTIPHGAICATHDKSTVKLINMLSLHAVIYFTDRYKKFVINILDEFIKEPYGGMDDILATKLHYFNVYAPKSPLFYQVDGHSEIATGTPLVPLF